MKNFLFSRPSSHRLRDHHSHNDSGKTQHHNFSETIMEENLDVAETMIKKWDIDSQKHDQFSSLFEHDRNEAKRFLEAVSDLQNAMHFYMKLSPSSENLVRAQNLMKTAIKILEKEFYFILVANRKNLDSKSVSDRSSLASTRSSISDIPSEVSEEEERKRSPHAPDIAMADLKSIADAMIGSGYAKECVNIYKIFRKSIIDESLYHLHIEKFTTSQIQKMDRSVLEHNIKNWLHAVKSAVKGLFYGERILCDFIFSLSEKIAASCFAEISRDAAVNLFSFPHNFARSKKILSSEKMFRGLDMYEAISDLCPEIESIFAHESLADVKSEAAAAVARLAEALRAMLSQFKVSIQKDTSNAPVNGGVHPLTRYVMNFLVFLGDYSGSVSDILRDLSAEARTPLPESYFSSPTSAAEDPSAAEITTHLAWLILVLLCKLDGKAAHYHDVALSYLFLANNLNYVVSKVRSSNLGPLIGPDWICKHASKVEQYLVNYEKMGWGRLMASLTEHPTVDTPEKFRNFFSELEAAYKKQKSWVIPDPKMCDDIKIYFSKNIASNYRVFYEQYRSGVGAESIIKYVPEDLDNYFSDMFSMKEAPDSNRSMLYPTLSDSSIFLQNGC